MTAEARAFLEQLEALPRPERERQILERRDLWIDWPLCPVPAAGGRVVLQVTADVYSLGSIDEPIRVPLSGPGAQRVADALGMMLVTPAISDAIWKAAAVHLAPMPMGPPEFPYDASMLTVERLLLHNEWIERQHRPLTAPPEALIAGHKKDVLLSNRLEADPGKVAIYGWHSLGGRPIQPLSLVHEQTYADYSHGIRLVSADVEVDGQPGKLEDVLGDKDLGPLLTGQGEGCLRVRRYPGSAPAQEQG